MAEAVCLCGKTITTRAYHLVKSQSTSCGCTRAAITASVNAIKRRKTYGWASMIQVYNSYRAGARRRNVDFTISKELFSVLSKQNCHYCGKEPDNVNKAARRYGEYVYSGIDRVDNSIGYVPSNVVPACYTCNRAKGTKSKNDFLAWVLTVAKYYEQRS
jgi:5-methylcytosine-specific restriction endonuclease McrA